MSGETLTKYYAFAQQEGPVGDDEVIAMITMDTVDRDGDVVVPTGIHLDDYKRSPVLMYAHSKGLPSDGAALMPIGKSKWIKPTSDSRGLVSKFQFDISDDFARKACSKVKGGFLTSYSVKFLPIKFGAPTKAEIARNPEWAQAKCIYREVSLLEVSLLAFPSNTNAITLVKGLDVADENTEPVVEQPIEELVPEIWTIDSFKAKYAQAGDLIAKTLAPAAVQDGFTAKAVEKGEKLGRLRTQILARVLTTLGDSLSTYLWTLVYDVREEEGSYEERLNQALMEFSEVAVMAFDAFEPLRMSEEGQQKMLALSKGISFEAKELFGDPAEQFLTGIAKAMDGFTGGEDAMPEMAFKPGDYVKCTAGHCKGYAKCMSVHKGGMVPDVEDDIMGTEDAPACRVKMCKQMGGGWMETEHHRGVKMSDCKKCAPLKMAKSKSLETNDPEWSNETIASLVQARLSSDEFRESVEKRVLEDWQVRVLGRVAPL
jgi:hypothetical protein